jgi:hypothetical protein
MKMSRSPEARGIVAALALALGLVAVPGRGQEAQPNPALAALVPRVEGWAAAEAPQSFFPDTLFEYIDGAAESYLSYDFRELLVVELEKAGTKATLTVEIYDMGLPVNAFGIFSAERYPENKPVPVGELGYVDGEALNFMTGRYYIKLLGFELGEGEEAVLTGIAGRLAAAVPEKESLPPYVRLFPGQNLVPRSEKYIKKNFMGYEFLRNGYVATYRDGDREFECFFAVADSDDEAENMSTELLDFLANDRQAVEKTGLGYHVKNRHGQHLFFARVRNVVCGVARLPDGLEAVGPKYLKALVDALMPAPRAAA